MNKKILFITYHFPPYGCIGALRTGKTVKKLTDLGYEVRVISASNQSLPKHLPMEVDVDKVFYTDWFFFQPNVTARNSISLCFQKYNC